MPERHVHQSSLLQARVRIRLMHSSTRLKERFGGALDDGDARARAKFPRYIWIDWIFGNGIDHSDYSIHNRTILGIRDRSYKIFG